METKQPETKAAATAVRAIIEWCGTTDPAHVLAAQLTGVYQPVINSMDDVAHLDKWAVIRDADGATLELGTDKDVWFQTGVQDPVILESVTFPATVMFPGVPA